MFKNNIVDEFEDYIIFSKNHYFYNVNFFDVCMFDIQLKIDEWYSLYEGTNTTSIYLKENFIKKIQELVDKQYINDFSIINNQIIFHCNNNIINKEYIGKLTFSQDNNIA